MTVRDDFILPFQVGDGSVRGRIVRLGPAIDQILSAHKFADPPSELLGEALALAALMGSSLKFDGKLIFQAQGAGDVRMIVADYTSGGAIRATASIGGPAAARGLGALMGKGHLAITIDQGPDMDRYQGVTPIEGVTLEEAAVAYFAQSEQIPTAVRLAVGKVARPGKGETWRAGGVIVQFMPGEGGDRERGEAALKSADDEEAWSRAASLLATTQSDELLDPVLTAEDLLYRLYHEDGVRVFDARPLRAHCACNAGKISAVLSRYAPEELSDLAEGGRIKVSCEFCRRDYLFDAEGNEAAT
ncbi:MAG: Hsp33 family molecular chaperone [Parvularculaceae bacterium]|nr:Hsp33 family molecular chaperone [Parvularculaceae bacterium]